MAKLIYSAITSLDGFVEDTTGSFDWAAPDEEVFSFVNELERPITVNLYGRRMYETMVWWEDPALLSDESAATREFAAIWQGAEKIVFSTTLISVTSAKTRLERAFTPELVRTLKAAAPTDISLGGAALASQALKAGVVDEIQLFLTPVVVGAGKRALPDDIHLPLELLDERRFANGVVYLRFSCAS